MFAGVFVAEIGDIGRFPNPKAWMQSINFIVFGLLVMAFAWGLDNGIGGSRSRLGPVLIGAFGLLAAVGNGVFPTDRYGAPETTVGSLHSLTAGLGFTALIVAMFVLPRRMRGDDEWADLAGLSRWMGAGSAALMLSYLVVSENDGLLDGQVGLVRRVFAFTVLTWLFILALRRYRVPTTRTPDTVPS